MRRTQAIFLSTGTALGCTGLALALTLAGASGGGPPPETPAAIATSLTAQLQRESHSLRVVGAERALADQRAERVADIADAVAAERSETFERATRAAERVALEKAAAAKAAAEAAAAAAAAAAEAARIANASPRELGQILAAKRGWTDGQWSCLDSLWRRESNWNPAARNRTSGAFGIPQALPGSKMASAGADWATNPATQIAWGLTYIENRYGSPCGAWSHSERNNWY